MWESPSATCAVLYCVMCSACMGQSCPGYWVPDAFGSGTDLSVYTCMVWDRDGDGPISPKLIVGGRFLQIGGIAANRIVAYDLMTGSWSPLGAGMSGDVGALAVHPNGTLLA